MLYVVTLYSVQSFAAESFVRSLRRGGELYSFAHCLAPELIATDILQHQASTATPSLSSTLFICLDFWISPGAYRRACSSLAVQHLLLARRRMANSAFELGAFAFPAFSEIKSTSEQPSAWG
jgi:hypothetical protein